MPKWLTKSNRWRSSINYQLLIAGLPKNFEELPVSTMKLPNIPVLLKSRLEFSGEDGSNLISLIPQNLMIYIRQGNGYGAVICSGIINGIDGLEIPSNSRFVTDVSRVGKQYISSAQK